MFETLKNVFRVKEMRRKLLYLIWMIFIIRIGCQIPVPGVDSSFFKQWFSSNAGDAFNFFDAFTGMMQMLLFFLLGLLAFPSQMPSIVLPAIAIALFLTFVARPAAVGLLLAPSKPPIGQYLVISWAGLRGAASIVFAIMATLSEGYMKYDIFHIVFCVVLFSIIFQGSLLPKVAEKCDMIDNSTDVM